MNVVSVEHYLHRLGVARAAEFNTFSLEIERGLGAKAFVTLRAHLLGYGGMRGRMQHARLVGTVCAMTTCTVFLCHWKSHMLIGKLTRLDAVASLAEFRCGFLQQVLCRGAVGGVASGAALILKRGMLKLRRIGRIDDLRMAFATHFLHGLQQIRRVI